MSTERDDFGVILLSIERMGVHKTAEALQQHMERVTWVSNPDALFILDMVSVVFKIPAEEIRRGVTRKNERRDAIGFCAYYLNTHLGYSIGQVSWMLMRSEDICYKYAALIRKLNANRTADKKYLQWRKLFDSKVEKYKLSLGQKTTAHE